MSEEIRSMLSSVELVEHLESKGIKFELMNKMQLNI